MKSKKVLNVRTHLGGLKGQTSYDSDKDRCDMELTPAGVLVKTLKGEPIMRNGKQVDILLPWPNCTEVLVESEDETKQLPRGPRAA